MFCHFPRLCGCIALVSMFLPLICLQISEHKDHAHENQCADSHPFLPEFSCGVMNRVMYLLRTARCAPVRRILCHSVESSWISAAPRPGIHSLQYGNRTFTTSLFRFFCSADCESLCAKKSACSPNLHGTLSITLTNSCRSCTCFSLLHEQW